MICGHKRCCRTFFFKLLGLVWRRRRIVDLMARGKHVHRLMSPWLFFVLVHEKLVFFLNRKFDAPLHRPPRLFFYLISKSRVIQSHLVIPSLLITPCDLHGPGQHVPCRKVRRDRPALYFRLIDRRRGVTRSHLESFIASPCDLLIGQGEVVGERALVERWY